MITRVKLENWKSHDATEMEFSEGTNVLVGIMGSGKSAVLDGITYGLFGTVPAVRNRRITLDDLIRKRPVKEDTAEVEVEFTNPQGMSYIVKRKIERGKGTTFAEIRQKDGKLIDKPNSTSVTEHVTALLQIDFDFYRRMIYAEQNQLDLFLTLEPRERRRRVDELLKINKFENARKNVVTIVNRLKDRLEDREEDLRELREDEEIEALPSLENELEETEAEKEELAEKKERIKPEIKKVEDRLHEFERVKNEIEELSKKVESVKARIETLNQQISKDKEKLGKHVDTNLGELEGRMEDLKERLQEKKEEAERLESEASSNTAEVSRLKAEKKSLQREIEDIKEKIEEKEKSQKELEGIDTSKLSEELENLKGNREDLRDKSSGLKARIKDLRSSLEELREAESDCPVCGRPLKPEKKNKLIQERNRRLEDLEAKLSDFRKKIKSVEADISDKKKLNEKARDLRKNIEDLPNLKSKLSGLREDLETKSNELAEARKKSKEVNETLKNMRQAVEEIREDFEKSKKLREARADLKSSREEKRKAENERKALQKKLESKEGEFDEGLVKNLKNRNQDLIKKQEHFKTRVNEIDKLIEQKKKLIENIREKKQKLERRKAEVGILRGSISSLNKIKRALSESQTALREQVIDAVNAMMNDIWQDIYPYGDFRRIRLAIEESGRTSDYELQLMDSSSAWVPVEGVVSGGERTCASLTLRIAFAVVLAPGLSWLVLDEPTHNLDSEGIEYLSEVLRGGIPEFVNQLLLITHERQLESAVSGNLHRFFRDKSQDGPTEVRRVYQED